MDPDPYHNTGKTCLGRGMHCPSASSYYNYYILIKNSSADLYISEPLLCLLLQERR